MQTIRDTRACFRRSDSELNIACVCCRSTTLNYAAQRKVCLRANHTRHRGTPCLSISEITNSIAARARQIWRGAQMRCLEYPQSETAACFVNCFTFCEQQHISTDPLRLSPSDVLIVEKQLFSIFCYAEHDVYEVIFPKCRQYAYGLAGYREDCT